MKFFIASFQTGINPMVPLVESHEGLDNSCNSHYRNHSAVNSGVSRRVSLFGPDDLFFVVRTQPRRERWAAENITRAGALYYLPEVMETVRLVVRGVKKREFRTRPLFPCYLFVHHPDHQWHFLLRTFGVAGVVPGAGDGPAFIRGSVLNSELRSREENGIVRLPVAAPQGFLPGQLVRVKQGSFAGYTGLVQGNLASERISILLNYMARKVPFLVKSDMLEAA